MALRILADENFPGPLVRGLRALGHDVAAIREDMAGAGDPAVLARARSQRRILVTFDKDFGELAFRTGLPAECGVVLFRLSGRSPARDNARVLSAIGSRGDWAGQFAVVTDTRIRMRPMA